MTYLFPPFLRHWLLVLASMSLLVGCDLDALQSDAEDQINEETAEEAEDNTNEENDDESIAENPVADDNRPQRPGRPDDDVNDAQLRQLAAQRGMTGQPYLNRVIPSIDDPLPQLGKKLFFSKSLGGEFDSACVTCHHPSLGGGDALALSVGVEAIDPDLLGIGRVHESGVPVVPRNAPTVFNLGLWDTGLFWDSRVESLGKEEGTNGSLSGIRTPDTPLGIADSNAGANLATAQARFPVTSAEEMRTHNFEEGSTNEEIRAHLAARIGNYGEGVNELAINNWAVEFETAYGVSGQDPEALVTFDNIANAIAEYERSMQFSNNPWNAFLQGDDDAINNSQKRGANLFLRARNNGGAGCATCHSGDLFSDGRHHTTAVPQIGVGKGDGTSGDDDFGLERETGDTDDRYRFRTASLLNIAVTAPYGHAGAFQSLRAAVRHYNNPRNSVEDYFDDGGWCQLEQFESIENCDQLYPNAESHSLAAVAELERKERVNNTLFVRAGLNNNELNDMLNFLQALTDPCVIDRECLAPWIADTASGGPDNMQLNARDEDGNLL